MWRATEVQLAAALLDRPARASGNVDRGQVLVRSHGCAACHTIVGIEQPRGVSAPPLAAFARRSYIAGVSPNTPDNLTRFIVAPPSRAPLTAMPPLGVNEAQAHDIAA